MIIRLCVTSRHDVASHQVVAFVKSEPNHIKLVTTPQAGATHGGVILDEIKAHVPKWIGVQIGGAINLCQHTTFGHVATLEPLGLCFEDDVYKMCKKDGSPENLIKDNDDLKVAWGRCLDSINEFDGQFRTAFEIQAWHSVGWKPSPIPYTPIPPEPIRLNLFEREQRVTEFLLRRGIPEDTPLTPLLLQNPTEMEAVLRSKQTFIDTIRRLKLAPGDPLIQYLFQREDQIPEYADINGGTECIPISNAFDDDYLNWGYKLAIRKKTIDDAVSECTEPKALQKAAWMKFVAESFAEITRRTPTPEGIAILVSYKEAGLIGDVGITASVPNPVSVVNTVTTLAGQTGDVNQQQIVQFLKQTGLTENDPAYQLLIANQDKFRMIPHIVVFTADLGVDPSHDTFQFFVEHANDTELLEKIGNTIKTLRVKSNEPLFSYLVFNSDKIPEYQYVPREAKLISQIDSLYKMWGNDFVESSETIDSIAEKYENGEGIKFPVLNAKGRAVWMKFVAESFAQVTRRNPTIEDVVTLVSYKEAGLIGNVGITASDQDKTEVKAAISRIGFLSTDAQTKLNTIVDTIRSL